MIARGQPTEPFRYADRGTMATIGRAAAVADLRGMHLSGFLAWLIWLFVHLMYLVGFRNRLPVSCNGCGTMSPTDAVYVSSWTMGSSRERAEQDKRQRPRHP